MADLRLGAAVRGGIFRGARHGARLRNSHEADERGCFSRYYRQSFASADVVFAKDARRGGGQRIRRNFNGRAWCGDADGDLRRPLPRVSGDGHCLLRGDGGEVGDLASLRTVDPRYSCGGFGLARRIVRALLLALMIGLFLLVLPVSAESGAAEEAYGTLLESLPRDVAARLPEGVFSEDLYKVGEAVRETTSFGRFMETVGEVLSSDLGGAFRLFAKLLGILVLTAVLNTVRASIGSEALARAVELCGSCAVTGALLSLTLDAMGRVTEFLGRLMALADGMIPVMGALLAMGGNVGTAVVSGGGMTLFLNIVERLCASTLMPVVGICVAVAVAGALFGGSNLRGISNFIKKTYTFFLGLVMTGMTFTLSVQTSLAAGADGIAMKSARLLAGRAIPVVGGAVGETLRTVAGSVGYLKTTVGSVGVGILALMLLPPLFTVVLYRLGLIAACAAADLLGCATESRLLDAFVTVFGYMLAVLCICSVGMVFLITLFAKCGVAMG